MALPKRQKVRQTTWELAVYDVIEFLDETKTEHKHFTTKKALLEELGIPHRNYPGWRQGDRHLPPAMHAKIEQVLLNKYLVLPAYLKTRKGSMFYKKPVGYGNEVHEGETAMVDVAALREEIENLKKLNASLQLNVDLLKRDNEALKNSAKNSAKGDAESA